MLYILFVAQLISAIGFSNIIPFLPLYVQELGTTTGLSVELLAGLVFSAQAATSMVIAPVWGVLADRFGRKMMIQRAVVGGAITLLLMGFVRSAEELVLIRAFQGLLTGILPAASALVASVAPKQRIGYAMGLLQVGHWAGVALGPVVGGITADFFGYRLACVITAILVTIAGLLIQFGVHEQFVPTLHETPGFNFISSWRRILAAPGVRPTYAVRFLSQLGTMMIFPIAPLFVQSLLVGSTGVNSITGAIVGVASATSTATAVYLGRLGDRVGHQRILVVSALLAGLFYLPQSMVTAAWQLFALQALAGAAVGGVIPSLSALLVRFTETGDEGSVYGLDSSIAAASRAVAPLVGATAAAWFSLRSTFVFSSAVFLLVSLLAVLWLSPSEQRRVDG